MLESDSGFGSLLRKEELNILMIGFGLRKPLQGCGGSVSISILICMYLREECVFSSWSVVRYLGVRLNIKIICI